MEKLNSDIIVALSTAVAKSAIAVVRISGKGSRKLTDNFFVSVSAKKVAEVPGYTAMFGKFMDNGTEIDEGIVLAFHEPYSYTGEEMAELYCHGNVEIAQKLISLAINYGARPATQGEFTRRAFENGKMDLSEAEAVAELINAEGEGAIRAAFNRKNGAVSKKINKICDELSEINAKLSVWSDYPEETDSPVITKESLKKELLKEKEQLEQLSKSFKTGDLLQRGITVAIAGKPNVGKSTLLNALVGEEKAIVTNIAGTTRDIVEAQTQIGKIPIRLLDTAGIHETENIIEKIGVDKAQNAIKGADLTLLLLDGSIPETKEDLNLMEEVKKGPHIIVSNKSDLPGKIKTDSLAISAKENRGLDELKEKILSVLGLSSFQDNVVLASERQHYCVLKANDALDEALITLNSGFTFDAVGIMIDSSLDALGELLGKNASDLTLEQVFSKFCVGK